MDEDPIISKLYTTFAFVGVSVMVLSRLYEKRQTRIDSNARFWQHFWNELFSKKKSVSLCNLLLDCEQHNEMIKDAYRAFNTTKLFDVLADHIHMEAASLTVRQHFNTTVNAYLAQISSQLSASQTLHSYLEEHPLRVCVPLCGSSYDLKYIAHTLSSVYKLKFKVIGIDFCAKAIAHFFDAHCLPCSTSTYNPKFYTASHLYRVVVHHCSSLCIEIIEHDLLRYFEFCKHLERDIKIQQTPCHLHSQSIDIIVDVNAMSCMDPSDRLMYVRAMKYWMKPGGVWLLHSYEYDPKYSNHPPYTMSHRDMSNNWFGTDDSLTLLHSEKKSNSSLGTECTSHSWLIRHTQQS